MNADVAEAERRFEVRSAARAWRAAGFISEPLSAKILGLYADDRVRYGVVFAILAFIMTGFAVGALIGASALFLPVSKGFAVLWGMALLAATEWQRGPMKRSSTGAESATALIGIVCLLAGLSEAVDNSFGEFCVLAVIVFGAAAYRLGEGIFFALVMLFLYVGLARTPNGRLLWFCVATALIAISLRAARSENLPPPHRRGAVVVLVMSTAAWYVAVNPWSWDHTWIESLGSRSVDSLGSHAPGVLATGLAPIVFLLAGWWRREPLLLGMGLVLTGLSIGTIRLYYSLMPLSLALVLIGTACLAVAIAVRRYLRDGPGGERRGFTADPLFDDTNRTEVIRAAFTAAAFTPDATRASADPAFRGGGGEFGGGGASSRF